MSNDGVHENHSSFWGIWLRRTQAAAPLFALDAKAASRCNCPNGSRIAGGDRHHGENSPCGINQNAIMPAAAA